VYVLDLATRAERRVTTCANRPDSIRVGAGWKRLAFQKQDGTTYIADLESGEIKKRSRHVTSG